MQIQHVEFGAFKSLYDVSCDLGEFTVITGPNGAGKSNFAEALNFLGEVYQHGLELAVSRAGGYENIAHRRARRAKQSIRLKVESTLDSSDLIDAISIPRRSSKERREKASEYAGMRFAHSFSLRATGQSVTADFEIIEESISIRSNTGIMLCEVYRTKDHEKPEVELDPALSSDPFLIELFDPFNDEGFIAFLIGDRVNKRMRASLRTVVSYASIFSYAFRRLQGIRVFQLSPQACRQPGVPTPNASLDRFGQNLPAAADHLRRNDIESWERVQEAMRSILPDIVSIEITYTEDRRLTLQFRERGVGRAWNTNEVSDGTVQALALLTALYDHRTPVLIVEEPENSVHPWILRQFVDRCRAADRKQVIFTSHSPVLLNYVDPQDVQLMWRVDGRSHIAALAGMDESVLQLWGAGELSLFDLYDSGLIAQAVPGGSDTGVEDS